MIWLALSVSVPPEFVPTAGAILARYGQGGAVIEEVVQGQSHPDLFVVSAYLPSTRPYKAVKKLILAEFSKSDCPPNLVFREKTLSKSDWMDSLKAHFRILEVGHNFVIKPSWVSPSAHRTERLEIQLDPGEAFGTGWHPSTHLCLLQLERHLHPGMSVLDLGTGTGILAIASARLGASSILALDTDPAALEAARSNAELNKVNGSISVRRGTLSPRLVARHLNEFDLVLANISGQTIAGLSDSFRKVLKSGGRLVLSGFTSQGLDEVLIKLALAGFSLDDLACEEDWRAVIARKPGPSV